MLPVCFRFLPSIWELESVSHVPGSLPKSKRSWWPFPFRSSWQDHWAWTSSSVSGSPWGGSEPPAPPRCWPSEMLDPLFLQAPRLSFRSSRDSRTHATPWFFMILFLVALKRRAEWALRWGTTTSNQPGTKRPLLGNVLGGEGIRQTDRRRGSPLLPH